MKTLIMILFVNLVLVGCGDDKAAGQRAADDQPSAPQGAIAIEDTSGEVAHVSAAALVAAYQAYAASLNQDLQVKQQLHARYSALAKNVFGITGSGAAAYGDRMADLMISRAGAVDNSVAMLNYLKQMGVSFNTSDSQVTQVMKLAGPEQAAKTYLNALKHSFEVLQLGEHSSIMQARQAVGL